MNLPIMQFLYFSVPYFLLDPNVFLSTLFFPVNVGGFHINIKQQATAAVK
jgi:hypothetical protein